MHFSFAKSANGAGPLETRGLVRSHRLKPPRAGSDCLYLGSVREIKRFDVDEKLKPLSKYKCYAEWGPWGQCDVCGKIGERRKIGECRLQKFAKAKMETPQGRVVEADFPIVGVGCHSFLLDQLPQAKKILSQIPNLVLIEKCEVSCVGYVTKPSKLKAFQRYSYLHKMKVKMMKKLNQALSSPAAGRTPKTFALQDDPSRSRHTSDPGAVLKYSLRQAVSSLGVFSRIPFPSRNIQKRVSFSGIIYLSPNRQNGRQGQGCHNSR
ncbi:hypothetical protein AVEN_24375-1 [Araneus ventricosus]|uniref:Uncharacterized protein n=1 Tax=Araneus ventricosus TaxID=182803 RepID=A0A4Y2HVI5_ARAVE|nr:hypothetical protein AVEN_24375-1 [Araneus ventricosus]